MKHNAPNALSAMRSARGRFFGLSTTQGETINAQFLGETPNYVRIYDRNADEDRRIAKRSLSAVNLGGGRRAR